MKSFRVRRTKIKDALEWLQANNPLYSAIVIKMNHLDWIKGEEGILEGHELHVEEMNTKADDTPQNADLGPAPAQALDPMGQGENIEAYGYIDEGGKGALSAGDWEIHNELRDVVAGMKNQNRLPWTGLRLKMRRCLNTELKRFFVLLFRGCFRVAWVIQRLPRKHQ